MDIISANISILNPLIKREEVEKIFEQLTNELNGLVLTSNLEKESYSFCFTLNKTKADWKLGGNCIVKTEVDPLEYIDSLSDDEIELFKTSGGLLSVAEYVLCENFSQRIFDFFIAFNLAYPGFFELSDIEIFYNDKKSKTIGTCICNLMDVYLESANKGWPEIKILPITRTWDWLNSKTNFLYGTSSNSIERALNAFTYLFNSPGYEDLFYCLLGIEAIYNSDQNNGVMEQIREKITLLIGLPEDGKKIIRNMYSVRSDFIHGRLNFPSKFTSLDGTKEFEKFVLDDYGNTLNTATGILVATLQKFIENNSNELETITQLRFK